MILELVKQLRFYEATQMAEKMPVPQQRNQALFLICKELIEQRNFRAALTTANVIFDLRTQSSVFALLCQKIKQLSHSEFIESFFPGWFSPNAKNRRKKLFIHAGRKECENLLPLLDKFKELDWEFYATEEVHDLLTFHGIHAFFLEKYSLEADLSMLFAESGIDLIFSFPGFGRQETAVNETISSFAQVANVPVIMDLELALIFLIRLSLPE